MKCITKYLIFIALFCIALVLSSYTVYGHNSGKIRGSSGYNYYGHIKNCRQCNNDRRIYRNYNYSNKKDYGIYVRFKRYIPSYLYKPYRYRRYGCK